MPPTGDRRAGLPPDVREVVEGFPFIDDTRLALADDLPERMVLVACLVLDMDRQVAADLGGEGGPAAGEPPLGALGILLSVEAREFTAVLAAARPLLTDPLLVAEIDAEIARRGHRLPAWLERFGETTATEAVRTECPGDPGLTIGLTLEAPGGPPFGFMVFLDRRWDGAVRDVSLSPDGARETLAPLFAATDDVALVPVEPGTAAAVIERGLRLHDEAGDLPAVAGEPGLPGQRPILDWVLRLLPAADGAARGADGAGRTADGEAQAAGWATLQSWLDEGGDLDADDDWDAGLDPLEELRVAVAERLEVEVGGVAALRDLDADPLPDEPFDGSGIAADVRAVVAEVVALTDECADRHFDVEMRTALRRFVRRAAVGKPEVFRRRASLARTAAAAVWAVGHNNRLIGGYSGQVPMKRLNAHFGITGSVASRGRTLVDAAVPEAPHDTMFGDAALLVSRRRAELVQVRTDFLGDDDGFLGDDDGDLLMDALTGDFDGALPPGVDVVHQPGMAARMLAELRPLLEEEGIVFDDDGAPVVDSAEQLDAAMAVAVERHNLDLFTPVGQRRDLAVKVTRRIVRVLLRGLDDAAHDLLDRAVVPESDDGTKAENAAVMGYTLGLLDNLLDGRDPAAPQGLRRAVRPPRDEGETDCGIDPAAAVLDAAKHGNAYASLDQLMVAEGSHPLAFGALRALAATVAAWAALTGEAPEDTLDRLVV